MAGLTARGRKARARIVDAAVSLFSTRGFGHTSVEDVLRASGTGKSQFYHYFENKAALMRATLRAIRTEEPGPLAVESWEGIRRWLDQIVDGARQGRLPSLASRLALSADALAEDHRLRTEVIRTTHLRRRVLYRGLRRMKRRDELSSEADPARLASFVAAAIEGGLYLADQGSDVAHLEWAIDEAWARLSSYAPTGSRP